MDKQAAPVLSTVSATLAAIAIGVTSMLLVGLNALTAALTCGDDGRLDFGTGGVAAKNYCRLTFDDGGDFSDGFASLSLLAIAAIIVTGTALVITRHRRWLYARLELLVVLAVWTVGLLILV